MAKKLVDLKIIELKSLCDILSIDRQGQKSQLLFRIKDCLSLELNSDSVRNKLIIERDCLKSEIDRYKNELDNSIKTLGLLQDDLSQQVRHTTFLEQQNSRLQEEIDFLKEAKSTQPAVISRTSAAPLRTTNRFQSLELIENKPESTSENVSLRSQKYHQTKYKKKRRKVLVMGDSHSRNIASSVSTNLSGKRSVTGSVHPGGRFNDVVQELPELTKDYQKEDTVVLVAGANDIYHNEFHNAKHHLLKSLNSLQHTNVLVVGVPHRHDLMPTSIVNKEIAKANRQFKKIIEGYQYCEFLDVSNFERDMFTNHGLHLNSRGKDHLALNISNVLTIGNNNTNQTIILPFTNSLN